MDSASRGGGDSRRMCVVVDLEGYRALAGLVQGPAQEALAAGLDRAAELLEVDRSRWFRQQTGDGEVAVLPADVPDGLVIDGFADALDRGLRELHDDGAPLLRVRVGLHVGITGDAALGQQGPGVIETTSIVGAEPVKQALRSAPDAGLLLALSHSLYEDRVLGGYTRFGPKDFRQVHIRGEKYSGRAFVRVLGVAPGLLRFDEPDLQSAASKPSDGARGQVHAQDSEVYLAGGDVSVSRGNQTIIASTGPVWAPHGNLGKGRGRRG